MARIEPPDAQALPLLRLIADMIKFGRIRENDPGTFLSYSEALLLLGVRSPLYFSGNRLLKGGLAALNKWTIANQQLPKIAALVVNKKSRLPGAGFVRSHGHSNNPLWMKWWHEEATKAIRYDWSPFLLARYGGEALADAQSMVRESGGKEAPSYGGVIVADPPPARIRRSRIAVADVLRWLASGQTESEIIRQYPVSLEDIRASLAYAADQENCKPAPRFTEQWTGKFKLPARNSGDARLDYLLERYERNRK